MLGSSCPGAGACNRSIALSHLGDHVGDKVKQGLASKLIQRFFCTDHEVDNLQEGDADISRNVKVEEHR